MKNKIVLFIIILTIIAGCKTKPGTSVSPLTSPVQPSPLQTPTPKVQIRPFQLDKPITAGATTVTGHGPANVPIILADVTFGGAILGTTVINSQGAFKFALSQPLEAQHRIGITLAELAGTGLTPADFHDKRFYGDEAFSVPQEGFFFDTCLIQ